MYILGKNGHKILCTPLDNTQALVYNMLVAEGTTSYEVKNLDEMATTTEYILQLVLELINKSKSLDELREAILKVLDEQKKSE